MIKKLRNCFSFWPPLTRDKSAVRFNSNFSDISALMRIEQILLTETASFLINLKTKI